MDVVNEVYPSNMEAFQERLASGSNDAVVMVNLLKFRSEAQYEDGDESAISGAEAYGRYMEVVRTVLPKLGAHIVYEGKVDFLALGQVEELWDKVLLIQYPSLAALVSLGGNERIQEALRHRVAGLSGQLLMEASDAR